MMKQLEGAHEGEDFEHIFSPPELVQLRGRNDIA